MKYYEHAEVGLVVVYHAASIPAETDKGIEKHKKKHTIVIKIDFECSFCYTHRVQTTHW